MKLFITVFSAIIAAAVAIGAVVWAVARVSDWEHAKQYSKSSILAEWDAVSASASGLSGLDAALAVERTLERAKRRVLDKERELLVLYENKPFGLPLSEQDRKDRDYIKQEIDKQTPNTTLSQLHEDSLRAQRKLKATTTTPTPTPIEVRKAKPVTKGGSQ